MNMILYNGLLAAAALVMAPWFAWRIIVTGKYRKSIGAKLGFHPAGTFEGLSGSPRIWVHAVSVGEVTAAAPILSRLRSRYPDAVLFLSTSTETGQEAARRLVPETTSCFYFPLDIPRVVRKVMDRVAPNIFVTVETELWPNFIGICRERSLKVVMVNGRLSPRSFRNYRATRFFWKKVLGRVDGAGVISETDGARLRVLGMDPARVSVLGNAKYDGLVERTDLSRREQAVRLLSLPDEIPVIVAGSTHNGEEEALLEVYDRLLPRIPDLVLILVPRHVDRAPGLLASLRDKGYGARLVALSDILNGSERGERTIVIVDVMGRLFDLYSVATLVYCGGSLVRRGGQNILEAAAWGKVVFHGPFMDDFREEEGLLGGAGAGITVRDAAELAEQMMVLLENPEERRRRGEAGRRMVKENQGAADRYAALVAAFLDPPR